MRVRRLVANVTLPQTVLSRWAGDQSTEAAVVAMFPRFAVNPAEWLRLLQRLRHLVFARVIVLLPNRNVLPIVFIRPSPNLWDMGTAVRL